MLPRHSSLALLLLLALPVLAAMVACLNEGSDQQAAIEERLAALDSTATNDAIVIKIRASDGSILTSRICDRPDDIQVEWAVSDSVFKDCWSLESPCAQQAEIGQPLPLACRSVRNSD